MHHGIKMIAIWYVFTDIALINCWNVLMSSESNKREAQHSFWKKHQMSHLTGKFGVEYLFSGPCMSLDSSSPRPLCVSVTQSKDWMRSSSTGVCDLESWNTRWCRRRAKSCETWRQTSCLSAMAPQPVHDASKPTPSALRTVYCTYSKKTEKGLAGIY